jgi:hypothetical protein
MRGELPGPQRVGLVSLAKPGDADGVRRTAALSPRGQEVIAQVVVVVNSRGLSEPPTPGARVSTYLPYWVVGAAPALMLLFYLWE